MAIQLNPTINDTFETKSLATLRQMVLDALGFIKPNNISSFHTRTLLDLRTDIKNRLGLATPMPVVTDTLLNIRTDVYNMLGFAAMGTHPPGVDTMLNAFINQAQQFLFRALELDKGTTTAPPVLTVDGNTCVLDRDAILRIALGNAKARWRQADAQIYLAEAKKYIDDLKGRAPPNIDNLVNAALQDAERVVSNRIEMSDFWVAGAAPTYGLTNADASSTVIDGEPVFLLALANLKASFKQDDAKAVGDQFETYMKNMVQRQPPNAKLVINRLLKDAQQYLYRMYPVFRMERWFTWTTVAGQRFYGVASDDGAPLSAPTGVTAIAGSNGAYGSLNQARARAASILLPSGQVLIIGGTDGFGVQQTCELYTPATGLFVYTGNLNVSRVQYAAALMQSGSVLVAGGSFGTPLNSAEVYNAAAGAFSLTGSMTVPRINSVAVALSNGKVLICGGQNNSGGLSSAELYDPASGTFTATGNMTSIRFLHSAVLLANGQVLITGGTDGGGGVLQTAELYDPVAGIFAATTGTLVTGRAQHASLRLANGNVLVLGGETTLAGAATTAAEIFSPTTGTFSNTSGAMGTARNSPMAVLLSNQTVLVAGGVATGGAILGTAEKYSPSTNNFSATGAMPAPVSNATPVVLQNGNVMIAGGFTTANAVLSSVAIFSGSVFTANGGLTAGTDFYRVAAFNSNGSTIPSTPEVLVSGIPSGTSVVVSWTLSTSPGVTGYAIYGRATGAEQLLGTVDALTNSFTDYGTLTPNGAMPVVNTTASAGSLDAREITWVGASSGDNTWRELIHGVDPLQYNGTWTGPPQRYEIRQAIELWPTPADSTWLLRIKGYFAPGSFEADADTTTIDWQAVYFKTVADALRAYKRPDEAKVEDAKLIDYVKRLVAGTHKTARYIPGNIPMRNTPPRPVIV